MSMRSILLVSLITLATAGCDSEEYSRSAGAIGVDTAGSPVALDTVSITDSMNAAIARDSGAVHHDSLTSIDTVPPVDTTE